jgi:ABC-2 type transport system permease protein
MLRLLKIEYYKYYKNPMTLIILGLFVLLMTLTISYADNVFGQAPPPFPNPKVFVEFPTVWDYQGYVGNWLVSLLLGFMMINFITTDETNKIMRQSIINGLLRTEYWKAKFIMVILLSTFATLIYVLVCLAYGFANTPDWDLELVLDANWGPVRFFIMSMGYLSMAALFGYWIKRGMLSMFIYLAYIMILEQIVRGVHFYYFKNRSVLFYPANIIEDLMPNPMLVSGDNFLNNDIGFHIILEYYEAFGLSLCLIALFTWLCYRLILKKDL